MGWLGEICRGAKVFSYLRALGKRDLIEKLAEKIIRNAREIQAGNPNAVIFSHEAFLALGIVEQNEEQYLDPALRLLVEWKDLSVYRSGEYVLFGRMGRN
jgi:hypothetical protein